MKAIHVFAVSLFACVSLASGSAHADKGDEFKVYGNVDLGLMFQPEHLSITSSGQKATFLGATGSKELMDNKKLVVGVKAEAGFAADTGIGAASNLQNTSDTGASTCSVQGAPGASCSVKANGSQGLVLSRELLGFVQWKDGFGKTHEVRVGRGYVPAFSNLQYANMYFGPTGVGSSIALASTYLGPTAIRASNLVSYRSPEYQGLSLSLNYALGENKFWGPGDLVGARGLFNHGGLHLGLAFQYTKANEGDVGMGSLSASYNFGSVTLTALGQVTGRYSTASSRSLTARFGHLEVDWNITQAVTVMAAAEWLGVRHTNDDSGQFAAGVLWKLPKDVTAYAKAAYVLNQGNATAHPAGTATVGAGEENHAAIVGGMMSF